MNKKSTIFITIFLLIVIISIGVFIYIKNINIPDSISNQNANYSADKIIAEENIVLNSNTANSENNGTLENQGPVQNIEVPIHQTQDYVPLESELSTFSTKIYNQEESRQNNIRLVTSALNGSVVKNGSTFSFTSIVGPATSEKGYKKANVIDKDGNNVPRSWWGYVSS